ncbi:MAG: hypothetical protein Q7S50_00115 [bacterium]|nr:hypothetical protein [bacterium]
MQGRHFKPVVREDGLALFRDGKNKQRLYSLLQIYDVFKDVIVFYGENVSHPPAELNIFYIRTLVPTIEGLVEELGMSPAGKGPIKLPEDYIPFTDLFTAESKYRGRGQKLEDVKMNVNAVYGQIKLLAEQTHVVFGVKAIPEVEKVVADTRELLHRLSTTGTQPEAQEAGEKISLEGKRITYDAKKRKIAVADSVNRTCSLVAAPLEAFFAEVMLSGTKDIGVPYPWDVVFVEWLKIRDDRVTMKDVLPERREAEPMYSAMNRLNEKVLSDIPTDDILFTWEGKTIRRNF